MKLPAESIAYLEAVLQRYIQELTDNPPEETEFDEDCKHFCWDMVRELKDDHYMASLPGYLAVPVLQQILGDLRVLGYQSAEEATDDLETLWDKVKLGASEGPLAAALRMADRFPVKFRTNRLSTIYQRFLNIGYHLQVMRGEHYISLPVDRLGEILGVNPRRVSDYRNFAQDAGFLHQIAKSCYSGNGGVATKFRFACQFVDGVAVPP